MSGPTLHRRRVGYAETDQGGVVHHSVYLQWLEQGRIEYLRERGVNVRDFEREHGLTLVVVDASIRYRSPARFDEEVDVETTLADRGAATLTFAYRVLREGALLAEATVRVACIELASGRPRRFPPAFLPAA